MSTKFSQFFKVFSNILKDRKSSVVLYVLPAPFLSVGTLLYHNFADNTRGLDKILQKNFPLADFHCSYILRARLLFFIKYICDSHALQNEQKKRPLERSCRSYRGVIPEARRTRRSPTPHRRRQARSRTSRPISQGCA